MKKLLYFSTAWCGPCKQFAPIMEQAAAQGVQIEKIDPEQQPAIASSYNIRSVPTVVLVDANGQKISSFTGTKPLNEVVSFYKNT